MRNCPILKFKKSLRLVSLAVLGIQLMSTAPQAMEEPSEAMPSLLQIKQGIGGFLEDSAVFNKSASTVLLSPTAKKSIEENPAKFIQSLVWATAAAAGYWSNILHAPVYPGIWLNSRRYRGMRGPQDAYDLSEVLIVKNSLFVRASTEIQEDPFFTACSLFWNMKKKLFKLSAFYLATDGLENEQPTPLLAKPTVDEFSDLVHNCLKEKNTFDSLFHEYMVVNYPPVVSALCPATSTHTSVHKHVRLTSVSPVELNFREPYRVLKAKIYALGTPDLSEARKDELRQSIEAQYLALEDGELLKISKFVKNKQSKLSLINGYISELAKKRRTEVETTGEQVDQDLQEAMPLLMEIVGTDQREIVEQIWKVTMQQQSVAKQPSTKPGEEAFLEGVKTDLKDFKGTPEEKNAAKKLSATLGGPQLRTLQKSHSPLELLAIQPLKPETKPQTSKTVISATKDVNIVILTPQQEALKERQKRLQQKRKKQIEAKETPAALMSSPATPSKPTPEQEAQWAARRAEKRVAKEAKRQEAAQKAQQELEERIKQQTEQEDKRQEEESLKKRAENKRRKEEAAQRKAEALLKDQQEREEKLKALTAAEAARKEEARLKEQEGRKKAQRKRNGGYTLDSQ